MEDSGDLATPFKPATAPWMASCQTSRGSFGQWSIEPVAPLQLHPATHALHYGSACFEGLKAHRGVDGRVRLFRAADHAARLGRTARALCLPEPDASMVVEMMEAVVAANEPDVPAAPASLYVRPTLLGTDANIGAAAAPSAEALLFMITSPMGDYYDPSRPLTVHVETQIPRTTPQFGQVKAGANYAMALGITLRARAEHGADQVLFAPGGDVQETGTSNVILLDDERVITKALDSTFLHGVTRDSVLTLARHLGYHVEERDVGVDELVEWAAHGEIALTGTAARLSSVGALVYDGRSITVGSGGLGSNTRRLRDELSAVQCGESEDRWGWTTTIDRAQQVTGGASST